MFENRNEDLRTTLNNEARDTIKSDSLRRSKTFKGFTNFQLGNGGQRQEFRRSGRERGYPWTRNVMNGKEVLSKSISNFSRFNQNSTINLKLNRSGKPFPMRSHVLPKLLGLRL
jgi:hypothetical protein